MTDTNNSPLSPVLAVTAAQERMWRAQHMQPESPHYVVGETLVISPDAVSGQSVDIEILLSSIAATVAEAETLRLVFLTTDDGVGITGQRVAPAGECPQARVFDLSTSPDPDRAVEGFVAARKVSLAAQWRHARYGVPLFEYTVLLLPGGVVTVVQLYHHLIVDGSATATLTHRIAAHYTATVEGKTLRPSRWAGMSDVAAADQSYRASAQCTADRQALVDMVAGHLDHALADQASAPAGDPAASTVTTAKELPLTVKEILEDAARTIGDCNWVSLALAGFVHLVHEVTGRTTISVAVPLAARVDKELVRTPCLAVTVLPLLVDYSPETETPATLARQIAAKLKDLSHHQRYRGEDLPQDVAAAGAGDIKTVAGLFHGVGANVKLFSQYVSFAGMTGELINVAGGPPEDFGLVVTVRKNSLSIGFETDPLRVSGTLAKQRLVALDNIWRGFADSTQSWHKVTECPTLATPSLKSVSQWLSDRLRGPLAGTTVVEDATTCAALTGWATDHEARIVAQEIRAALDQTRGNGSSSPVVAVDTGRTVATAIGIVACLYAGVTFVTLDATVPSRRMKEILSDADPAVIVVAESTGLSPSVAEHKKQSTPTVVVRLADIDPSTSTEFLDDLPVIDPEAVAYMIYTSGTTGTPKAVEITRRNFMALINSHLRGIHKEVAGVCGNTPLTVAHCASFSFDAALDQLLWMTTGNTVRIYPPEATTDAVALVDTFAADRIGIVDATPSLLEQLLTAGLLDKVPTLGVVIAGGESIGQSLWDELVDGVAVAYNVYGPTESTVDALVARMTPGPVTIGFPLANVTMSVRDDTGAPVKNGDTGILWLGGDQIARGYRHNPSRTAEVFTGGEYNTGDRVAVDPDGRGVLFLGRRDNQVSIHGQRVEIADVTHQLLSLDFVVDAQVTLRRNSQGQHTLGAQVVLASGAQATPATLRDQLAALLPPAAIPTVWSISNGTDAATNTQAAYTTATKTVPTRTAPALPHLLTIVGDVLCVGDELNPMRSFVDLGGDSISALTVATLLRDKGWVIVPQALIGNQSLSAVADGAESLVEDSFGPTGDGSSHTGPPSISAMETRIGRGGVGNVPITPVAARQLAAVGTVEGLCGYAQWMEMVFDRPVTRRALEAAAGDLLTVHPMLRAVFIPGAQNLLCVPRAVPTVRDWIVSELSGQSTELSPDVVARDGVARIDPRAGRMLHMVLMPGGVKAVIVIHHVACDALSWPIIADTLSISLSTRLADVHAVPRIGGEAVPFRIIAAAQQQFLHSDTTPLSDTVADRMSWTGVVNTGCLTDQVAADWRTRPAVLLQAAVAAAVSEHFTSNNGATTPIILALEGHGRDSVTGGDTASTVGWVTTETPARFIWDKRVEKTTAAGDVVVAVKQALLKTSQGPTTAPGAENHAPAFGPVSINVLPPLPASRHRDDNRGTTGRLCNATPDGMLGLVEDPSRHMTDLVAVTLQPLVSQTGYTCEIVIPSRLGSDEDAKKIAQSISTWCTSLATMADAGHVRRTPGDYPLVDLTQDDVDRLCGGSGGKTLAPDDVLPLSPLQEGLAFVALTSPDDDPYVLAMGVDVQIGEGITDEILADAFRAIVARHKALRVHIDIDSTAEPVQVVAAPADALETLVIGIVSDAGTTGDGHNILAQEAEFSRLARAVRNRTVDITGATPMVQLTIVHTNDPGTRHLIFGAHHLVTDGWSTPVMLGEFVRLATARAEGKKGGDLVEFLPPAPDYRNYFTWLASRDLHATLGLWAKELDNCEPAILGKEDSVGTEPDKDAALFSGGEEQDEIHLELDLTDQEQQAVTDRARSWGVTEASYIQAAWGVVLAEELGSRESVCFGVTVSGRDPAVVGGDLMIGPFATTVPARFDVQDDFYAATQDFHARRSALAAAAADVCTMTSIEQACGRKHLIDTLVVVENFPGGHAPGTADSDEGPTDVVVKDVIDYGQTHYAVTVVRRPTGGPCPVRLSYRPALIEQVKARRLAGRLAQVLSTGLLIT